MTSTASSVSDQELQAYWLSLGRFIATFAEMEAMLFITATEACEIPAYKLLAIGPSFRADGSMDIIKRIIEFRKDLPDVKLHLTQTLEQVAHINNARNMLLHNPTKYRPNEFVATNSLLARKKDLVRTLPISANILDDMTEDLHTAWARLWYFQDHALTSRGFQSTDDAGFKRYIDGLLHRAWLYKPVQQSSKSQRNPSKNP